MVAPLADENSSLSQADSSNRSVFDDPFLGLILADRYQILELIGRGGWGNVYRARHVSLDLDFAIKIVHRHHLQDEASLKRFEQEAQVLSRVENQHIVKVMDHGLFVLAAV